MRIFISERKSGGRERGLKGKEKEKRNKKGERERKEEGRRGRKRERVDAVALLAVKMKDWTTNQGRKEASRNWKRQGNGSSPRVT